MKKTIDCFDYAGQICKSMKKGILLTTAAEGKVNTMTIGWGKIGIEWGRPIFLAYVRQSRFTREMLDRTGEFTVNIPVDEVDNRILGYCGTKSGRDTDKIKDMELTLEAPEVIGVPGIREFPLTLECKVIYRQLQDLSGIQPVIIQRYYPEEGELHTADAHILYYGEIVSAYMITE